MNQSENNSDTTLNITSLIGGVSSSALECAKAWQQKGKSFSEIETLLTSEGFKQEDVSKTVKQLRHEKHRRIGVSLIVVGLLLCGAGFAATLILADSPSGFNLALFGLPTIGVSSLVGGLALIMG